MKPKENKSRKQRIEKKWKKNLIKKRNRKQRRKKRKASVQNEHENGQSHFNRKMKKVKEEQKEAFV